jgi:hypothetical protein
MKLIKKDDIFYLYVDKSWAIASTDSRDNRDKKLSKQNCEEEFAKAMGVVDVEKLARELETLDEKTRVHDFKTREKIGFKIGFNKAMELNKDKVFTLEQVLNAFYAGWISKDKTYPEAQKSYKGYLERHVMQPTEIEVEFVMDICGDKVYAVPEPRLTEQGEYLLKKI